MKKRVGMVRIIKLKTRKGLIIFVRYLVRVIKWLERGNVVYFYGVGNENGYCSNFSNHPIEVDGLLFNSVEAFYQYEKFTSNVEIQEAIRLARSPAACKSLARRNTQLIRSDWEMVKVDVMKAGIRYKFSQHSEIREKLLETEGVIIENAMFDSYWGCGAEGIGLNMLGRLLVELRDELNSVST